MKKKSRENKKNRNRDTHSEKRTDLLLLQRLITKQYASLLVGSLTIVSLLFFSSRFIHVASVKGTETVDTQRKIQNLHVGKNYSKGEVMYIVKQGDNLKNIAFQFCHSINAWRFIVTSNNIQPPYIVYTGSTLHISCP